MRTSDMEAAFRKEAGDAAIVAEGNAAETPFANARTRHPPSEARQDLHLAPDDLGTSQGNRLKRCGVEPVLDRVDLGFE